MHIAYLSNLDPERAERIKRLRAEGYEVIVTDSVNEAEKSLESGSADVLLYEWPFAEKLRWIKKRFITVEREVRVTFDKFLEDLKQAFPKSFTD